MGRPSKNQKWREAIGRSVTKLTPEVVGKLKQAFAIGATIPQACYYAEIHPDTYYSWVKKYPKLSDEFTRMRQRLPLAAKTNLATAIETTKDIPLSKWLVERTESDEYGEKVKVEHSGAIETTPEEDKAAIAAFHASLKENLKKRSLELAKKEGELQ